MNSRRATAFKAAATVVAVLAVLVGVFALMVAYGVTVEYGAGVVTLPDFVLFAGLPLVLALVAALLWPGRTLLGFVAFLIVVPLALVAAVALGERQNEANLVRGSVEFACDDVVDPRVDEAFASLPRPAPIYGPVGGGPSECTAGISGGEASLEKVRVALRSSDWRVVRDEPARVVAVRRGVRATVYLDGGTPLMRVAVISSGR
ncbi:MAG TPA: hypothetical protein VFT00_08480 [Nocardioides sp.]|nr:hypothetical protein [Nocardioides sp.]